MSDKSKNRNLIAIIILSIIIIVGAITNPDESLHKAKVKNFIYSQSNLEDEFFNSTSSNNDWETVGTALGLSLGMSMIDKLIDNLVTVDNYVIFSITNVTYKGEKNAVCYGLFGNVFIVKSKDIY